MLPVLHSFRLLLLLLTVCAAHSQTNFQIVAVHGEGLFSIDSGRTWAKAEANAFEFENAHFKTGSNSWIDFRFTNIAAVRVTAESELVINRPQNDGTNVVLSFELKKGRTVQLVEIMAAGSKFEIATPTGVCGLIAPSRFDFDAQGLLRCDSGKIAVVLLTPSIGKAPSTVVHGGVLCRLQKHPELAHSSVVVEKLVPRDQAALTADLNALGKNATDFDARKTQR